MDCINYLNNYDFEMINKKNNNNNNQNNTQYCFPKFVCECGE